MSQNTMHTPDSGHIDFLDHYELIAENEQIQPCSSENGCRFCGRMAPEASFRQVTHLIPELLGRNETRTSDECDACNQLFSGFESHLAVLFRPQLAMLQVQGKSKVPKFHSRGKSYDGINPGLTLKQDAQGQRYLEVRDDTAVHFDDKDKTGQITFQKQPFIPIKAYKALLKIGLSMLPADQLTPYQPVFDWLQGGEVRFGYIARAWKTTLLRKQYERPNAKLYQARHIVKDGQEYPEHVLILGFANVVLQLFSPFSQAFDQLHDSRNRLSLTLFPAFLYDDLSDRKSVNIEAMDLSSDKALEEDEEMHLTFGGRIRQTTIQTPNG